MAVDRSPRFPIIGLPDAITHVENLFEEEGRSVVAEKIAVTRFGYTTLNGNSAKVLSAMRKYGLIEDATNGVKVSADGIIIAAHRQNPTHPERALAITRSAERVELFQALRKEFGPSPSEQNLIAQLVVRGFTPDGAARAARAYRATTALVDALNEGYHATPEASPANEEVPPSKPSGGAPSAQEAHTGTRTPAPAHAAHQASGVRLMDGERVVFTEEGGPSHYLKLVASGEIDDTLLEALEDFVKRQRKRLQAAEGTRRSDVRPN